MFVRYERRRNKSIQSKPIKQNKKRRRIKERRKNRAKAFKAVTEVDHLSPFGKDREFACDFRELSLCDEEDMRQQHSTETMPAALWREHNSTTPHTAKLAAVGSGGEETYHNTATLWWGSNSTTLHRNTMAAAMSGDEIPRPTTNKASIDHTCTHTHTIHTNTYIQTHASTQLPGTMVTLPGSKPAEISPAQPTNEEMQKKAKFDDIPTKRCWWEKEGRKDRERRERQKDRKTERDQGREGQRKMERERERHRKTEKDRERQKKTEKDRKNRERQRKTDTRREREK